MGRAGFDWVCLDMQHGLVGVDALAPMLLALNRTDTPALVRLPWKSDASAIGRALDYGAQGVIVPMLETPEEAAAVAAACRYAPLGMRSWGPVRIARELPDYTPQVGDALVVCLIMIETRQGLERVDELLGVEGVDGAYIGPADLTISNAAGLDFSSANTRLGELAGVVLEACRRHGKIAAFHASGADEAARWSERGFEMVAVTDDAGLVHRGALG